MQTYEMYMRRCLQLAQLGAGFVAPNPMVGSILVYGNRIIGEGYHKKYGGPHAEVNCINSVSEKDQPFIAESTLYVSLEPCAHFGKTPPCADLIIQYKIKRVVIGCRDPFVEVNGKGIEKLEQAGIKVVMNILEKECKELNKRFFVFHTLQKPYIILKWAQSNNGMIAKDDGTAVSISNVFTNRMVHRLRSEEAGIMVGTNTAKNDNPQLNTRFWTGNNPVRLVLDINLKLPAHLKIFDLEQPTIIFNKFKHEENGKLIYFKIEEAKPVIAQVLRACYQLNIQSILVEGGARLLQSFIDCAFWDEAIIIKNETLIIEGGIAAPVLTNAIIKMSEQNFTDRITHYTPNNF